MTKKRDLIDTLDATLNLYNKIKKMPEFERFSESVISNFESIKIKETKEITATRLKVSREALAEIIDNPESVDILVELPGTKAENIDIELRYPAVFISTKDKKFSGVSKLPDYDYDFESTESTHRNGILSIHFPKKKKFITKSEDIPSDIDLEFKEGDKSER